jgi:hypothetical protein
MDSILDSFDDDLPKTLLGNDTEDNYSTVVVASGFIWVSRYGKSPVRIRVRIDPLHPKVYMCRKR